MQPNWHTQLKKSELEEINLSLERMYPRDAAVERAKEWVPKTVKCWCWAPGTWVSQRGRCHEDMQVYVYASFRLIGAFGIVIAAIIWHIRQRMSVGRTDENAPWEVPFLLLFAFPV